MISFLMVALTSILLLADIAYAGQLTIKFICFDADSGSSIPAQLSITSPRPLKQLDGSTYQLSLDSKKAPAQLEFTVKASAGIHYYDRTFTAYLSSLSFDYDNMAYYHIYLARKTARSVPYTRGDVASARKYIESKTAVDRSYALLTRMKTEFPDTPASQFKVLYDYNLADSAYHNCTVRHIDTCDEAQRLAKDLLNQINNTKNKVHFKNEDVTETKLRTISNGVNDDLLRQKYRRAKWYKDQGRIKEVKEDISYVKNMASNDSEVYKKIQVDSAEVETIFKWAHSQTEKKPSASK